MKKIALFICMGAAVLLSCTKEESFKAETPKTVISVGIAQTKTTIGPSEEGKHAIYWANGDVLQANGFVSEALANVEANSTEASFTFNGVVEGPVNYLYPATYYKDASTITLPASQGASAVLPMYGQSETPANASLNSLTAILQLSLVAAEGGDSHMVKSVELSSDTKALSGDFAIDYATGALTGGAAADNKLTAYVRKTLSSKPDTLLMSVPAGTYNLTVKVKDNQGHVMTKTLSGKTFEAGKYITLPALSFFPTTTETDITINNTDEWNAFATSVNDGEAGMSSSSVVIAADLDFTGKEFIPLRKALYGTVYGQNHTIKGIALTNEPVFIALYPDATVQDLNIDATSTLTVNAECPSTYCAPMVSDLRGELKNCSSAASVSVTYSTESTEPMFIGGLAGRIKSGKISECSVSGTIRNTQVDTVKIYHYVGGIAGDLNIYESNPARSIENSTFSGKILFGPDAGTTETGATGIVSSHATGFRIGGIVGRNQNGATLSGCTTTAEAVIDVRGDILVLHLGGIIGNAQAAVSDCNNNASVSAYSTIKGSDVSGGTLNLGGVAGGNAAVLSNCNNSGAISDCAAQRTTSCGGIAGLNSGTITGCTNSGTVSENVARPRYLFLGGVAGWNKSGTLSDVHNTAAVSVGYVCISSDYGKTYCGGVIGYNQNDVDGTKITNSGDVSVSITKTTYLQVALGGIIAVNDASISGAKNTGLVTATCSAAVTSSKKTPYFTALGGIVGAQLAGSNHAAIAECENNASNVTTVPGVYGNITSSTASTCMNWCEGGIVGLIYDADVTVDKCTNNAYVYHKANAKNTGGRSSFTGGIVGKVDASTKPVIIRECTNAGQMQGSNYSNSLDATCPAMGGTVGAAIGSEGNAVSITNCSNSGTSAEARLYMYRGAVGGVVGSASYANISGCSVEKIVTGNANATYFGGVAGICENTAISNCTVSSAISAGKILGGIASKLGTGSSTSSCTFGGSITAGTNTTAMAAVAAESVAGTTISSTVIKSTATVGGAAASADDAYVCADGNATITGTSIE